MFAETFASQGYVVLEKLFDRALIDSAADEYRRQYEQIDPANPPMHLDVGDKRLQLPVQLRGAFLDANLYANPLLMGVLGLVFKSRFVIDSLTCVTALSGAGKQRDHRDHNSLFEDAPELGASVPPYAVTVVIPLVDLDEMTGTTKLYPGSVGQVRQATGEPPAFAGEYCPFVKRGDCFLMDYRLWHAGMANRSAADRPVLYVTYSREWFTDVRNFRFHPRLKMDRADIGRIPPEHRQMFRRLAAHGLHDMSINELLDGA